jgi:hypothetical protein
VSNSQSRNGASTYAPQAASAPVVAQSAQIALLLAILGFMVPALGVLAVVKSQAAREQIAASAGGKTGMHLVERARLLGIVSLFFWACVCIMYAIALR